MIYAILCRQKVPGTAVCRPNPTAGKAVKYNPQSHICLKYFVTQTMGDEARRSECLVDARSLAEARDAVKTAGYGRSQNGGLGTESKRWAKDGVKTGS